MRPETSTLSAPNTISAGPALAWGWRATFKNWLTWVVLTAVGLAAVVLSFLVLPVTTPLVIAALILPLGSVNVLRQARQTRFRLGDVRATEYQETLLTSLFVVAACVAVVTAWSTVITGGLADLFVAPTTNQGAPFYQTALFWLLVGGILGINLLTPLLSMVMLYAADAMSVWEAARPGYRAAKRNYGSLLAISLAATALNLVGLALAVVGLLITLPVGALAFAHAYLQVSGQPLPEKATSK